MKLIGTGEEELFGLGIATVFDCGIFFENACQGVADLVFISAALGLHGKSDGWFRDGDAGEYDWMRRIAQSVSRSGFPELGDGEEISRVGFADGNHGLALRNLQRPELFGLSFCLVVIGAIGAHGSRIKLDETYASGKRIRYGFENIGRVRLLARYGAFHRLIGFGIRCCDFADGCRGREEIRNSIQDLCDADIECRAGIENREQDALQDAGFQPLDKFRLVQRAFGEEFLHERVAAFGDHFDQLVAHLRHFVLVLRRNFFFLKLTGAVARVPVGFVRDDADDAAEIPLHAQRYLERYGAAAESFFQGCKAPFAARVVAVELVDHDHPGQGILVAKFPYFLRLHFDSCNRIHHDYRRIRSAQGKPCLGQERPKAGSVQDVDFFLVPFAVSQRTADTDLAFNLLIFPVGDGIAVFDTGQTIDRTGIE